MPSCGVRLPSARPGSKSNRMQPKENRGGANVVDFSPATETYNGSPRHECKYMRANSKKGVNRAVMNCAQDTHCLGNARLALCAIRLRVQHCEALPPTLVCCTIQSTIGGYKNNDQNGSGVNL
eukprot:1731264-Amphidinium_carterae.2